MGRWYLALALTAGMILPAGAAVAAEPVMFDQQVGLEYQSWTWGTTQYVTPLRVFTVTDHTGALFGGLMNVAENESSRRSAERDAIRQGKSTYTYTVTEARAREGTRFGLTVGTGDVTSATGTGAPANGTASSIMAMLSLKGDLFQVFDGVVTLNSGVGYWLTRGPLDAAGRMRAFEYSAWDWPLGVTYRYAVPFLPGLVIEPGASFNWLWTLSNGVDGKWNMDCRNVGIEAGYYVHPRLKLRAGYHLGRIANNQRNGTAPIADMSNATVGVTAVF